MSQCTSAFEMYLPILVTFHTQSISSHIKVWETLYFANLFKIKFKVTLNIGVTKVWPLFMFTPPIHLCSPLFALPHPCLHSPLPPSFIRICSCTSFAIAAVAAGADAAIAHPTLFVPTCSCSHLHLHVLALCLFVLTCLCTLLPLCSFIPTHLCLIGCAGSWSPLFGLHLCSFILVQAHSGSPASCLFKYQIHN